MYKTVEANYKNVVIVTELASMGSMAFFVQGTKRNIKNKATTQVDLSQLEKSM